MTTTTRARVRSRSGTAGLDLHRQTCATTSAGSAWSDRCTCAHVRGRHDATRHEPVPIPGVGRAAVCTGRNLAGPCLWPDCTCTRFTNPGIEGQP